MKRTCIILVVACLFLSCNQQPKVEETMKENNAKRSEELIAILPTEIPGNVIEMIGNEWMLITAGNKDAYNTMTASWGTLGQLWGKAVSTCYVRPERFTYGFMEKSDYYTLCFFEEEYREALQYCGSKSGRDHTDKNKAEVAGLTPAYTENGSVYFKEAYLVLECKKLYAEQFQEANFTKNDIVKSIYGENNGIHKAYIGEIANCWIKKEIDNTDDGTSKSKTVLSVIHERKSVRKFLKDKEIAKSDVDAIVKAGMAAPSGRDARPWEIIVVNDRQILDAMAEKLPYAKMLAEAPMAIVVCGDINKSEYWYVDCSAVTQNILLAVEALGLGAVWTATYPYEDRMSVVTEYLKTPAHITSLCVIPIGYPEGEHHPKDKYDESKLHYNKW